MKNETIEFSVSEPIAFKDYLLDKLMDSQFDINLTTPKQIPGTFSMETASVIAAGAGVISAALVAMFAYLSKTRSAMINIRAKDKYGREFEISVPSTATNDQIKQYLELAEDWVSARVIIN